jgi:hypothetical protein
MGRASMKTTIDMAREANIVPYIVGPTNAEYLERLKAFEALVRADERNALTKESDKLRNRIAYLLQPPIVVAVGCFLLAYILGFK